MTEERMSDEEIGDDFADIFDTVLLSEELEEIIYGDFIEETTDFIVFRPRISKKILFFSVETYGLELIQEMYDKGFEFVHIIEEDYIFKKIKDD